MQVLAHKRDKGFNRLHAVDKLIPALKNSGLQDGTNMNNMDGAWLRYRSYDKNFKTYMWCIVNRKASIVTSFYEDTTDD